MGRTRKTRKDLPQRVYFNHGSYYFVDRAGKWHKLGKDYYEAMVKYADLNQTTGAMMTLGQVMDRYQRDVIPKKAIRTQQDNLREIKLLRQVFGHMRPGDVTKQDVYAYMDARPAVRANRERALLSHIFTKAIRWGAASDNPCRGVEGNKEAPRRRYVTDAEFWSVYEVAPPVIQAAMMLSVLTGLRMGDLLRLRRNDCTEDGILVTTNKTGKALLFEWTDDLRDAVKAAKGVPRKVDGMYLLCTRKGQRYTVEGFKTLWQRVIKKAHEDGVIAERFQWRDLRAKSGSDHEDGKHLGHQDGRVLARHYRRKPEKVTPVARPIFGKS